MGKQVMVTGGSGYVGYNLAKTLARDDDIDKVILLDIVPPLPDKYRSDKITFVKADICDESQVFSAFHLTGCIDCVFHTAGNGLSGTANLPAFDDVVEKVNVRGTRNVVAACLRFKVTALLFTSTVNVHFNKTAILNGNEDTFSENLKMGEYIDKYSETKHRAEHIVLDASSKGLRTCILRLGGIYGEGERFMMPTCIRCIQAGFLDYLGVAKPDLKIDLLHIDNAVQAHVKAMRGLFEESSASCVDRQIFYINDGLPQNIQFFIGPLYKYFRGRELPASTISLPQCILVFISYIYFYLSKLIGKRMKLPYWAFTPMEAYKMTVDHYFSIEKARNVLGYNPVVRDDVWPGIMESLSNLKRAPPTAPSPRCGSPVTASLPFFTQRLFIVFSGFFVLTTLAL